jgi:hypothetical protein
MQHLLLNLSDLISSDAFAQRVRHPSFPKAFTRDRKLPLPVLIAALLSMCASSQQTLLDTFFTNLDAIRLRITIVLPQRWTARRGYAKANVRSEGCRSQSATTAKGPDPDIASKTLDVGWWGWRAQAPFAWSDSRRADTAGKAKTGRCPRRTLVRERGPQNANHAAHRVTDDPMTDWGYRCFVPVALIEQALPAIHLHEV